MTNLQEIKHYYNLIHIWLFISSYLTLLRPMEFPMKFDTVKSGWSIVYIEGTHAIISKNVI